MSAEPVGWLTSWHPAPLEPHLACLLPVFPSYPGTPEPGRMGTQTHTHFLSSFSLSLSLSLPPYDACSRTLMMSQVLSLPLPPSLLMMSQMLRGHWAGLCRLNFSVRKTWGPRRLHLDSPDLILRNPSHKPPNGLPIHSPLGTPRVFHNPVGYPIFLSIPHSQYCVVNFVWSLMTRIAGKWTMKRVISQGGEGGTGATPQGFTPILPGLGVVEVVWGASHQVHT